MGMLSQKAVYMINRSPTIGIWVLTFVGLPIVEPIPQPRTVSSFWDPSQLLFLYALLSAVFTFVVTGRILWRRLERVVDLEAPWYRCAESSCEGSSWSSYELRKSVSRPPTCPRCGKQTCNAGSQGEGGPMLASGKESLIVI